ncbi:MAG: alpha/beta hydrolase [Bacteroidales bacterium]|nr:alpha/beta hydrolase [Bacteroidales bacterium]
MSEFLSFQETPVHYRTTGSGPWVLLIHGFLESTEIWDAFATHLAEKFSVLMVDLPGHGRSGQTAGIHTMEYLATSVFAVTDHLGISSFSICGHSMGGYVGLQMAEMRPAMVKSIVLFHSHAAPDDEKARENRLRTINIVTQDRTGFIQQFIPELFAEENKKRLANEIEVLKNRSASTSARSIVASLQGMKERAGSLQFLMETSIPVLFIIGRNDSRMPYSKVVAQAMLPAHAETLLLNRVGHMGFLEAPEKIFPAITSFFERNL